MADGAFGGGAGDKDNNEDRAAELSRSDLVKRFQVDSIKISLRTPNHCA
jgi:hypothetical protein